jgi:3-methyladenine DNA glycosylase AlkD
MKKYLNEVEGRLKKLRQKSKPATFLAENYIGGGLSSLNYLNIKIPLVRKEFKQGFTFSDLSPREQWKIWDYIWHHSKTFEVMLMASYWVRTRPFDEILNNHQIVLNWLVRVDNWGHSDELSGLYSRLLEHSHKDFLPVFEKWNKSDNPWFKRQSLVGLMYYSRMRVQVPTYSTVIRFVERHIDDSHFYVQKAIGWTLRECWNVYPQNTFSYLKANAKRIPAAGWTAATEKLSKKDKRTLIELRKK